jgi:hypothetical protein
MPNGPTPRAVGPRHTKFPAEVLTLGSLDQASWALVCVTGALAVVTGVLAVSTWRSAAKAGEAAEAATRTAKAAEADIDQSRRLIEIGQSQAAATARQSEIAQRALDASVQPLLAPIAVREAIHRRLYAADGQTTEIQVGPEPKTWADAPRSEFWAVVPIRNIGNGPAVIGMQPGQIAFKPFYLGAGELAGRSSLQVLAPGDSADVVFHRTGLDENLKLLISAPAADSRQGTFEIRYSDIAGTRGFLSRFQLSKGQAPMMRVIEMELEEFSPDS